MEGGRTKEICREKHREADLNDWRQTVRETGRHKILDLVTESK